jgi:signal peptidase I
MKAGIRDVLETALLTLVIFLAVRLAVQNFRVEGSSMEPTLHTNQYLLVNKVGYLVGQPHRGDIVVLRFPLDPRRDFIKRIVGLPGEQVEVKGGSVYVNGQALVEPYLLQRPAYTYPPTTLPSRQYFVLGDNRNNSDDSHVWNGLPRGDIIGKAWVSYWPPSTWGIVSHDDVRSAAAGANLSQRPRPTFKPQIDALLG